MHQLTEHELDQHIMAASECIGSLDLWPGAKSQDVALTLMIALSSVLTSEGASQQKAMAFINKMMPEILDFVSDDRKVIN
jgi:hypothetical protein